MKRSDLSLPEWGSLRYHARDRSESRGQSPTSPTWCWCPEQRRRPMRLFHTLPARAEHPTATSAAETRLHGRRLLLARLLWLAVAFFSVALVVASVPIALDV